MHWVRAENAMGVMGVLGFQTFKLAFRLYNKLQLLA